MGILDFLSGNQLDQDLRFKKEGGATGSSVPVLPIASDIETNLRDERTFTDTRTYTQTETNTITNTSDFTDARTISIITGSAGASAGGAQLKKAQAISPEVTPTVTPTVTPSSSRSDDDKEGLDLERIALFAGLAAVGVAFFGGFD